MKTIIPPIKSQGIKTKLVDWISSQVQKSDYGRWVEPFMGTGVVAFNIRPRHALLCDSNPHIVAFYNSVKRGDISGSVVRKYLSSEGQKLRETNGDHYYFVRERFNRDGDPLDFLFLSRSCFNGMMRFNRKGGFNVPFCKKPNRFAPALITKIVNQVENVSTLINQKDFSFQNQDFDITIENAQENDLIYCDPPYIGRNVDYFDSWSEEDERKLHAVLTSSKAVFILSTWLMNKYRTNNLIFDLWQDCFISVKEHFYHIGGKEQNRNSVFEALLSNKQLGKSISNQEMKSYLVKFGKPLVASPKKPKTQEVQLKLL